MSASKKLQKETIYLAEQTLWPTDASYLKEQVVNVSFPQRCPVQLLLAFWILSAAAPWNVPELCYHLYWTSSRILATT